MNIDIEKVENGYVTTLGLLHTRRVHVNIESVFKELLLHLEGRSENFGGESYGRVEVHAKEDDHA